MPFPKNKSNTVLRVSTLRRLFFFCRRAADYFIIQFLYEIVNNTYGDNSNAKQNKQNSRYAQIPFVMIGHFLLFHQPPVGLIQDNHKQTTNNADTSKNNSKIKTHT